MTEQAQGLRAHISRHVGRAFYPACKSDIEEPLSLIAPLVDEVVFCDPNDALAPAFSRWRSATKPRVTWLRKGAVEALEELGEFDVLFYRRDSDGEGGSRVFVLGDVFMRKLLPLFHNGRGLIITDGSNERGGLFRKMRRPSGLIRHGYSFSPIIEPTIEAAGLTPIAVQRLPGAV
ncbi:hypothetical protein [Microvirga aerophila]|nr:hypothetical protein [Microvirga aerophila]